MEVVQSRAERREESDPGLALLPGHTGHGGLDGTGDGRVQAQPEDRGRDRRDEDDHRQVGHPVPAIAPPLSDLHTGLHEAVEPFPGNNEVVHFFLRESPLFDDSNDRN
jgi:hypothetical protein